MSKLIHLEVFRGKVDRESGVISGVNLIRVGPAKGHDMDIDSLTLEQVMKLFPATGLKAKINHRDKSGVRSINGRYKNPRVEDGKIRADWHVLAAHPDTEWLFQLAENQPEDCGISLSCHAFKAYGNDGRQKMRVKSLYSGDLVDDPAANETLLEAGSVDNPEESMELKELSDKLDAFCTKQEKTVTDLSAKMEKFESFAANLGKALGDGADDEPGESKELAAVKKSLTELGTKFETLSETLKTAGQKPAPTAATDTNLSTDAGKTAEEKTLEGKLKSAKEALDKSFGLQKVELAAKYQKDFGDHWKTRLIELEAKK